MYEGPKRPPANLILFNSRAGLTTNDNLLRAAGPFKLNVSPVQMLTPAPSWQRYFIL
jgi:hypothetical protein